MAQADHQVPESVHSEFAVDTEFHLPVNMAQVYEYVQNDEVRGLFEEFGPPFPATDGWWEPYAKADLEGESFLKQLLDTASGDDGVEKEDILTHKDDLGLDVMLLNPPENMPLASSRTPKLMNELTRAYHDFLLDTVIDVDKGLYGVGIVPVWDPSWGEAELERIGSKEGIVAAANWLNLRKPFGVTEYDGLFERLTSNGLSLLLHRAPSSMFYQTMDRNLQTMTENKVATEGKTMIGSIINMIYTGVFDVYPDLNVVVQGFGGSWIPYVADRGDEIAQVGGNTLHLTNRMYDSDSESLQRRPSEYVRDNIYATINPNYLPESDELLEATLKVMHAENTLLFATNWPQESTDGLEWLENPVVSDDLTRSVLADNPREIFDIN